MKIINYLAIILVSLLAISCSKITDPVNKIGIGKRAINYQADEKVGSLVIPPDLTAPSSDGEFTAVIGVSDDETGINLNLKKWKKKKILNWKPKYELGIFDLKSNMANESYKSFGKRLPRMMPQSNEIQQYFCV